MKRTLFIIIWVILMMPLQLSYAASITIRTGESITVSNTDQPGATVTGIWSKEGDAFSITTSVTDRRSVTIVGNRVGTGVLKWEGSINGSSIRKLSWDVEVKAKVVYVGNAPQKKFMVTSEDPPTCQLGLGFIRLGAEDGRGILQSWSSPVNVPEEASKYKVTKIASYAFFECKLSSLTLPKTITCIDYDAFSGANNLKTLTINATTPPQLLAFANNGETNAYEETTVYVPEGCVAKYRRAPNWSNFKKIKKIGSDDPISPIKINATNFPDANFRNYLLAQSYGSDGELSGNEISQIEELKVSNKGIASLKGIEHFTALITLYCIGNNLTSLDVSKNTELATLCVSDNLLTSIDVSKNSGLRYFTCDHNQLTQLDVSKNTELDWLECYDNKLTKLDVSKNVLLEWFNCENNSLTRLDITKNVALYYLSIYGNQIKGAEMDFLVNSLPLGENPSSLQPYSFYVFDETSGSEGNVLTKAQATIVKSKGWTPFYRDSSDWKWKEYNGGQDDPIRITKITLNPTSLSMYVGDSKQITTTITPSNATDKSVTWSTNKSSVAKVSSTGVVTAIGEGNATITCRANDGSGVSATCSITVTRTNTNPVISFVSVTCNNSNLNSLTTNDKLYFRAVFKNTGATAKVKTIIGVLNKEKTKVLYRSNEIEKNFPENQQVTIDYEYSLSNVPEGNYFATVLYFQNWGDTDKQMWYYYNTESLKEIYVKKSVLVTNITLNPSSLSLSVGDTKQLTTIITPSNATNNSVTWSSNNKNVATVNSSGLVSAVGEGSTTITCRANDGSGVYATCEVTVKAEGYKSIGKGVLRDYFFKDETDVEILQDQKEKNYFKILRPYDGITNSFKGENYRGAEEMEIVILGPGWELDGIPITINGIIYYDDINTGYYNNNYESYIEICHPAAFIKYQSEEYWTHNKVLSYQENGLPEKIQLAPYYYMEDIGGWDYTQEDNVVIITFPKVTSGIDDVKIDDQNNNNRIFNMSGQKLDKPQKGINIINGRKVVVK